MPRRSDGGRGGSAVADAPSAPKARHGCVRPTRRRGAACQRFRTAGWRPARPPCRPRRARRRPTASCSLLAETCRATRRQGRYVRPSSRASSWCTSAAAFVERFLDGLGHRRHNQPPFRAQLSPRNWLREHPAPTAANVFARSTAPTPRSGGDRAPAGRSSSDYCMPAHGTVADAPSAPDRARRSARLHNHAAVASSATRSYGAGPASAVRGYTAVALTSSLGLTPHLPGQL